MANDLGLPPVDLTADQRLELVSILTNSYSNIELLTDKLGIVTNQWTYAKMVLTIGPDDFRVLVDNSGKIARVQRAYDWTTDGIPVDWDDADDYNTIAIDKAILHEAYNYLSFLARYLDTLNGYYANPDRQTGGFEP